MPLPDRCWLKLLYLLIALMTCPVQAAPADSAARWLIEQIDTALPGTISYDRLEAGLTGPILFENLRYEDGELRVRVAHFQLNWSLSALLSRTAQIDLLQASDIEIHLPPPVPEPPPEPSPPLVLSDIALPVAITIERGEVDNVRVYSYGNPDPLILNSARLRLRTVEQTLQLEQFTVQTPELAVALAGQVTPIGNYPLALTLSWAYQDPLLDRLTGQGQVAGDLTALQLRHTLSGAVNADLKADIRQALTQPTWDVVLNLNIADLAPFAPDLASAGLSGQLQSSGNLDGYSASGTLATTAVPEVGTVNAEFKASGNTQTLTLQTLSLSTSTQPLRLALAGNLNLAGQTVDLKGQWQELAWPLHGTAQFASPRGEFAVTGTFDDYRLQLDTLLSGPDFGRLRAEIVAQGSSQQAQLTTLRITAPDGELALVATATVRFADLAFAAQGEWSDLVLPLVGPPQAQSPSGRFTAQGTPQNYQATLDAQLTGTLPRPVSAQLRLNGTPDTVNLSELSLRTSGQGPQLTAQGKVGLADLSFAIDGQWQALVWPLIGAPQVQSTRGQLHAVGKPDDYAFELATDVQGPDIPPGHWEIQGNGSTEALAKLTINGRTLGGILAADLQARWLPAVSWSGRITASDIQPGQQWPDVPGRLALAVQSAGQLTASGVEARVELEKLSGTLRGQTIAGSGRVLVAGERLTVEALELKAGKARLAVAGELADRWNIDWTLQVASLAQLLPELRGRIDSQGHLTGTAAAPRAEFTLQVADLVAAGQKIDALTSSGLIDLSGASASKLDISGRGLNVGGQRFQRLTLNGSGTPAAHVLKAALAGELGQFALALEGGLSATQQWQGRLTALSLEKTLAGDWQLATPVALNAGASSAQLGDLCLQSRPTRLCVSGNWSASSGATAKLRLDNLTPARFRQWLPKDLSIDTQLAANAEVRVPPDGAFQGTANLQLAAGQVRFQVQGHALTIPLRDSTLSVNATPRVADSKLRVDLGAFGTLNADVKVADPTGQPRLDGRIQAAFNDLTAIELFAPQVEKVRGRIVADLGVRGAATRPDLSGALRLVDGGLVVPLAGISVTDLALALEGQRDKLVIDGGLRSGSGRLQINGDIDPIGQKVTLRLAGEQFQLVKTQEVQASISPHITIAVAGGTVRVTGEVQIPQATIAPPKLPPSGVGVSSDVVIVRGAKGETLTPVERTAQQVFVAVRVILGDAVRVDVGDFQGRLVGNLLVEQSPQLAPRATGNIGVASGTYEVYGQDLDIQRGQVLFSGGPVDNPGLDLRVARSVEADDVTAGVNVGGTLRNPQLKLFSEPAMPDTSILSYLIFGRAPDARAGSESQLLLRLAASLSASGGNLFTGKLAAATGLDTLEFESGQTVEQTSLLLGKYLTPDLYVGYGIGLFERVNSFNIRYQLNKRLSLESRSSAESMGADLIYTIER